MQGKSISFWFSIIDVDEDNLLTISDVSQLVKELSPSSDSCLYLSPVQRVWTELCDQCMAPTDRPLRLQDIRRNNVGAYCFQQLVLQNLDSMECVSPRSDEATSVTLV